MNKLSDKLNLKKDFPETSYEQWKSIAEKDLKGLPFDKKLITPTYEGIELQPIYVPDDIKYNPLTDNYPGFSNFVRGSKAAANTENCWIISQNYYYSSPQKFNTALKQDISRGIKGVNIKFDYPTYLSYDADNKYDGKFGINGTSVNTLEDLEVMFSGIDLNKISLNIETGFLPYNIYSLFIAYLQKSSYNLKNIKINFLTNPVKFALDYGVFPADFNSSLKEIYEICKNNKDKGLYFKMIGLDGNIFINAGGSAVQELAYTFAQAMYYIDYFLNKGLSLKDITSGMFFTFGLSPFYFMEVAKLRAARIIWSNIIDFYEGTEEDKQIFIHSATSDYYFSKGDIYVNLLRTTTEAFSAILGGANSIQTSAFDDILNSPDEFSRRIARNTQIILKEESHLNSVIDPAGGSYYIETLTKQIAESAYDKLKNIISKGGIIEMIKSGELQKDIKSTAEKRMSDYKKRKKVIVGNNMYANIKESIPEKKQDNISSDRISYIEKYRIEGEDYKHKQAMNALDKLNKNPDSIDEIINAFNNYCTLGEVNKARNLEQEEIQIEKFDYSRASEPFEELRNMSNSIKEKNGELPKVFLCTMGGIKQHKTRADFARGFFEVAGFDVIYKKGFDKADDAVSVAKESGARNIVICSTDEMYPDIVPELTRKLKKEIPGCVILLAGYPKDQVEEYKKNGIDEFIYIGADVYEINKKLLSQS